MNWALLPESHVAVVATAVLIFASFFFFFDFFLRDQLPDPRGRERNCWQAGELSERGLSLNIARLSGKIV